jgi:zinc protease
MTLVQGDKTKEALTEVVKEVRGIAGERPIAGDEFASIMRTEALGLPGRFATLTSIENAGIDMLTYGYPPDYYSKYAQNVHALTAADLASAAKKYIHPDEMVWIVAGDLSKIERGIRELALGDVVRVNTDGQPIR